MSQKRDAANRRTVIKSGSALLGVLGMSGSVSALSQDGGSERSEEDIRGVGSWEPDKEDIELASNTPGPTQAGDIEYSSLTYIDSLEAGGDIYTDTGGIYLGETDHFLHFYRGDETDDNGNFLYYLAFWSSGDPDHNFSSVRELSHEVELDNSDWNFTQWDPSSTYDVDCTEVEVGVGVSYKGANMSISQTVDVCNGVLEPFSGIGLQNFGFEFDGGTIGAGPGDRRYSKGVAMFRADEELNEYDLQFNIDWNPYGEMILL